MRHYRTLCALEAQAARMAVWTLLAGDCVEARRWAVCAVTFDDLATEEFATPWAAAEA